MKFENKNAVSCLQVVILCWLQFVCTLCQAQSGTARFTHLTTGEGLSQSSVFSILKDSKGFMWFGTDEGLNKYDGYTFTVYKHDPADTGSISNNSIYGLIEDEMHNLWIASSGGLDKFDRVKESFLHFSCGDNTVEFKTIFQDKKNRIWLGTTEGLCLFDPHTVKFMFYKNIDGDINSLSQNYVYKITEDNYGELWIGTRNGLNRFNPETGKFARYYNDPLNSKSICAGYIKTVYKDHKGNIWVGTQGSGIAVYNQKDNSFTNFRNDPDNPNTLSHNDILSFGEDQRGNLWIGTENGGISVFDYVRSKFVCYKNNENDASSISGNSIYSIYKDDIGNMWAGTWSAGINFLAFFGDKFPLYRHIPNNSNSLSNNLVLSISNGPGNSVWFGTDGGGLSSFDPVTGNFASYRHNKANKNSIYNDYVLSIAEYSPGVLALGFHHGGMDLFDIKKQIVTHFPAKNLNLKNSTSPSLSVLFSDSRQNLWVATYDNGGIYSFNEKARKFTNLFKDQKTGESTGDRSILVMFESKAGQVWLGGDEGLILFDMNTRASVHYKHDPNDIHSLSNNSVYSIMEDQTGNLWLGTAGGLNRFDVKTKVFTVFTEKDGLPNNTIWSTRQDRSGNLWISTNNGLSKFNPVTRVFRNYTISDGLQNNAFKAKASFQAPNGQMFFGGVNGFNAFFPDSIKDNNFVPPVYFTALRIFNQPVGIGDNSPLKGSLNLVKEITLSYKQSVFTIEFAALNFTHPEQNMYAYKLEGFDKEWNYVGRKRTATYTNLDHGTYIFKVKGSNNDGVWNDKATAIKIIITPPFWLTGWFVTFSTILILSLLLLVYRLRINRVKKWGRQLEQQVAERTSQLAHSTEEEQKARVEADNARFETDQANKELERKNKEMEQFAYIASHDLQEPLRTTSSFVGLLQKQYKGQLDEKADKYFNFILDASERMKTLIKNLLEYSRIGSAKELVSIDCNVVLGNVIADLHVAIKESGAHISYSTLPVISGYSTELKQLFQNLLINAIKFRKKDVSPVINIGVEKKNNQWEFIVKDNGIGIALQHQEKIFNIFQRLHSVAEYEGSGIGLSYCKKIVELHHGKIWVISTPGEGSAFYFTIRTNLTG